MCRPLYYSISYTINPWMVPGSENKNIAYIQWEKLVRVYKQLGIKVNLIDQKPNLPDMVFATDQGIPFQDKFVVSNFRYAERRKETKAYLDWIKSYGFKLMFLPKGIFLEGGGDCIFFGKFLLVGTGFRTSKKVCKFLSSRLGIKILCLNLINHYFYHLDTALFVLNDETIFYYPQAFSKKSQKVLQNIVPNLIPLTDFEVRNFAANSVVTDNQVIINRNLPSFKNTLKSLGYEAIEVDLNEFTKSGGAAHCLTQVLKEKQA